jgi:hypothetical protein
MPARSQAQQEMMGADLARLRKGQPTRTGMSEQQLKDFASTPRKGLPKKVKPDTHLGQAMKTHR